MSRWFKLDLECLLSLNRVVRSVKEWETSLDSKENVPLVRLARLSRRELIFKSRFLLEHLQVMLSQSKMKAMRLMKREQAI